jgi:hypothetical protein
MQPLDIESGAAVVEVESPKESTTQGWNAKSVIIGVCVTILWICSTWALIYQFSFGPSTRDAIDLNPFETTASFEYTGEDIVQDSLFTLVHGQKSNSAFTTKGGCVSFEEASGSFKQICLTDNYRIQTMRFRSKELKVSQSVVLKTGLDVFVTIYDNHKPVLSIFSASEKDLSVYNFDEIAVTYINDHVYSDPKQILLEVDGPMNTPEPCVKFSNTAPGVRVGVSNLLICGQSGENTVELNEQKLAEIGIDLRKLAKDFPYVSTGGLSSMTMHTFDGVKKSVLSLANAEFKDISQHNYQDSTGKYNDWSNGLQGFLISYQ